MKLPIPDDWNEATDGYCLGLVCIPNSVFWRSIVRGQIQALAYGRLWDEQTGRIKDVQVVGNQIFESLCMTCTDVFDNINLNLAELAGKLDTLNATLQALPVSQELIDAILGVSSEINEQGAGLNQRFGTANTHLLNLATIGDNTGAIADIAEATRVVLETQSGALINGLNTLLGDVSDRLVSIAARLSPDDASAIYTALLSLQLTCSPVTNITVPVPSVNVQCGTAFGGEQQAGPIDETPPGWHPPENPPVDRKCRVANIIIDGCASLSGEFQEYGVDNLAALGIGLIGITISAILAKYGIWSGARWVFGTVTSIVSAILAGQVDFGRQRAGFVASREDFVCALYEAQNASGALSEFLNVADNAGFTDEDKVIWQNLFFATGSLSLLWNEAASTESWPDIHLTEADIEAYDMTGKGCASCEGETEQCPTFDFQNDGALGWTENTVNCSVPLPRGGAASVAIGAEGFHLSSTAGSGTRAVEIKSPSGLGITITPNMLTTLYYRHLGPANAVYDVSLVTNLGCRVLGGSIIGAGEKSSQLNWNVYAGEVISEVRIYFNSSVGQLTGEYVHRLVFCA